MKLFGVSRSSKRVETVTRTATATGAPNGNRLRASKGVMIATTKMTSSHRGPAGPSDLWTCATTYAMPIPTPARIATSNQWRKASRPSDFTG